MSEQLQFDDKRSRGVERTYATRDIVEQRRATLEALALRAGERVIDVGCGPGYLCAEMAAAGASVVGVDPSPSMLALAEQRGSGVELLQGDALSLPVEDGSFDAVVSTQVYEYVADLPRALAEAHRVLRPKGCLAVLDTDWASIVWRSSDDARMRRLLAAWDEHLAHPHLPQALSPLLRDAGFRVTERTTIPLLNAGWDPDTFSRHLIGFISAFVPGRQGITEDEVAAWAQDLVDQGPDYFFSLNRYLFIAER